MNMTDEEQIIALLKQNQALLEKTHAAAEKTRKYILYSVLFTVIAFILPLIAVALILPSFISTYAESLSGASIM
jgi:type II secretory pathway component PulF